ncbi:LacI family transcriptional regulator [Salipaludibacillus neizhouensis]|uniref:LacI family transcriptional regulator n=1 Tax=Salipaludibacillus neizhouensis TaxID=885475 RepID=A0A3A9K5N9_9BACI|nr:LacI family DNA-binding transcriptional regulator [Salipaludibacillus neizhouensis]RKL65003.1 LacI family transcriptional regulator [Salipaludibacillus neizhouensis]
MSKIDDVAKLANVSKGTVSNVFSQKRPISEKVRIRVLDAAQELKYTPNQIARSLVTKKTMTISLNIPHSKNLSLSTFHTNLINGVITEASAQNYRILIDTLSQDQLDLPFLSRDAVDGVVILNPRSDDSRLKYLKHFGIPFVVIGEPSDEYIDQVSYTDNNNEEIVREITLFLLEKGHERILYLNAPSIMTVSKVREKGFYQAYKDLSLSPEQAKVYFKESLSEDPGVYGYEKVLEYLQDNKGEFTAIITDTDKVALGALRALKELDLIIPEDISIIALSDDLVLSHELTPPLSTVDMDATKLGQESVRMLFNQLGVGDFEPSKKKIVKAKFKPRGSCAKAKD